MNKRQLKKTARKFFKQLIKSGLTQDVVYKTTISEPVYDVVKGKEIFQVDEMEVTAYITKYSRYELSDDIQITDSKAMVLIEDLVVTPRIDDTVEYDGNEYHVISIISDPVNPSIVLQLRSA